MRIRGSGYMDILGMDQSGLHIETAVELDGYARRGQTWGQFHCFSVACPWS
jgi:hypothetical protein